MECGRWPGEVWVRGVRENKVAVAPWVGSCWRVSPLTPLVGWGGGGGSGPLTQLDVADGTPQVLFGHGLADHHQQVELAV